MTNVAPQRELAVDGGRINVTVDDVNDIQARLVARYVSPTSPTNEGRPSGVTLSGMVRGPFCDSSRTLPAEYQFHSAGGDVVEAVIPDPCQWSPELPHVYHVEVEARLGGQIVATHVSSIGLRRTGPRRSGIEFPG